MDRRFYSPWINPELDDFDFPVAWHGLAWWEREEQRARDEADLERRLDAMMKAAQPALEQEIARKASREIAETNPSHHTPTPQRKSGFKLGSIPLP